MTKLRSSNTISSNSRKHFRSAKFYHPGGGANSWKTYYITHNLNFRALEIKIMTKTSATVSTTHIDWQYDYNDHGHGGHYGYYAHTVNENQIKLDLSNGYAGDTIVDIYTLGNLDYT